MDKKTRNMIIVGSTIASLGAAMLIAVTDHNTAYWNCSSCGNDFKVSFIEYLKAPHIFNKRKLKCPLCGNKTYHKTLRDFSDN